MYDAPTISINGGVQGQGSGPASAAASASASGSGSGSGVGGSGSGAGAGAGASTEANMRVSVNNGAGGYGYEYEYEYEYETHTRAGLSGSTAQQQQPSLSISTATSATAGPSSAGPSYHPHAHALAHVQSAPPSAYPHAEQGHGHPPHHSLTPHAQHHPHSHHPQHQHQHQPSVSPQPPAHSLPPTQAHAQFQGYTCTHPQAHSYAHSHSNLSHPPPGAGPSAHAMAASASASGSGPGTASVNPLDPSTYFPQSYPTGVSRVHPPPPSEPPFTSHHPDGGHHPGVYAFPAGPGPGPGGPGGMGGMAGGHRVVGYAGPSQPYGNHHGSGSTSYIPGEIPHETLLGPPTMGGPPHLSNAPGPHSIQVHGYPLEEWADWDEDADHVEWPADVHGQHVEVRHRRKTSPEQLKVLEHWFNINPKPDNHMREWLAGELGMTKRNIQVWFQNRRAKIKSNAFKNRATPTPTPKKSDTLNALPPDALKTPERQISSHQAQTPTQSQAQTTHNLVDSPAAQAQTGVSTPSDEDDLPAPLLAVSAGPSVANGTLPAPLDPPYTSLAIPHAPATLPLSGPAMNGGRRVSLANGEAERIQVWAAKRTAQSALGGTGQRSPMGVGALMGTQLGQAAAARRGSIPYPYPAGNGYLSQISPRISPSVRHTPSALHMAAIRNNTTRRSSMPGAPQLISSGAFTPPRVVDGTVQQRAQQLDPIRDDHESIFGGSADGYVFGDAGNALPTTYLTPPQTSFLPSDTSSANSSLMFTGSEYDFNGGAPAGAAAGMLYTPAGPLPAPGFSFGSTPAAPDLANAFPTLAGQPEGMASAGQGFTFGDNHDPRTREMELFLQFRDKGRLDSMASASGYGSDGTTGTANGSSYGQPEPWEWNQQGQGMQMQVRSAGLEGLQLPMGFNPDRRASAPEGLQHDLGMLGLELHGNQLGPSPLGQGQEEHVRHLSGGDPFVPSIALHGSTEGHRGPLTVTTNADFLVPGPSGSGPSSAVDANGFTLSPVDMSMSLSMSPHTGAGYASGHSSGGPSPDAGVKASQSMPLPHGHATHPRFVQQYNAGEGSQQQLWLDLGNDPSLQGLPAPPADGQLVQGQHGQSVSAPTTAFMGAFGST